MARKIQAELDLRTARAVRAAKQAKGEVKAFGPAAQKAGEQAGKGMGVAAQATSRFRGEIVTLGLSYVGLTSLLRTITAIVEAYNKAITLRDQFVQRGLGMMEQLGGMPAQFGLLHGQALTLATDIARGAGLGKRDIGGVSGLLTALASAGAIPTGAIRRGRGEGYLAPPGLVPAVGDIAAFAGYAGVGGEAQATLAKLVSKGLGQRPMTRANVGQVLGSMQQAFVLSEVSEWGQFFGGAAGAVIPQMAEGVGWETSMSEYAALLKMRYRAMTSGEMSRLVHEQVFTGDRPEIVRWIGRDKYFRMKEEDPDALKRLIIGGLIAPTGKQRAKLFRRLKIAPELGARIGAIRAVEPERRVIEERMRGATGERITGLLEEWRTGPLATANVLGMEAELATAHRDVPSVRAAGFRELAEAELERWGEEAPLAKGWYTATHFKAQELAEGYRRYMARRYREIYGKEPPERAMYWRPDVAGRRAEFEWTKPPDWLRAREAKLAKEGLTVPEFLEMYPEFQPILTPGQAPATTTQPSAPESSMAPIHYHIGNFFAQPPGDLARNPYSRIPEGIA